MGGRQVSRTAQRAAMAIMQQAAAPAAGVGQVLVMPPSRPVKTSRVSSSVRPSTQVQSGGVVVDTLVRPNSQVSGSVVVQVPRDNTGAGGGFSFAMPPEVVEAAAGTTVLVTLAGGGEIPGWLEFNADTIEFAASAVPDGGLSIALRVTLGDREITIVLSEQGNKWPPISKLDLSI